MLAQINEEQDPNRTERIFRFLDVDTGIAERGEVVNI